MQATLVPNESCSVEECSLVYNNHILGIAHGMRNELHLASEVTPEHACVAARA
jgi:hypothetical protein